MGRSLAGGALAGERCEAGRCEAGRSDPEAGRRVGFVVSGKRMLITSAMLSIVVCTAPCSVLTSWSRARVWLSVPSAFFTQVFPSGSVEAYSASKSAPMDFATF